MISIRFSEKGDSESPFFSLFRLDLYYADMLSMAATPH